MYVLGWYKLFLKFGIVFCFYEVQCEPYVKCMFTNLIFLLAVLFMYYKLMYELFESHIGQSYKLKVEDSDDVMKIISLTLKFIIIYATSLWWISLWK